MNNHYNSRLKNNARKLRNESVSKAEKHIWKALLSREKTGVAFKRQRPIDFFIVDFFAQEVGLIIEIDGSSHFNKGEYDYYRQTKLETLGFMVIRFSEGEVIQDLDSVGQQIIRAIECLKGGGV
ncbi:MAG: very-short-patch-repair endonuclease [Lentimonas sp.]|jgi:very-short-patch-repair endonuclease